jgi:hypothetical protein
MAELKKLSPAAIPAALAKAERYRLLNEPEQAESICEDVLAIDPSNGDAQVSLVLALSDQLAAAHDTGPVLARAQELARALASPYQRAYCLGLVAERRARAVLARGGAGAHGHAGQWLREAMQYFAEAEGLRPADDDAAILRWNACARLIARYPALLESPAAERTEPVTSE